MQTQVDPNGCGPAALVNALHAVGLHQATQEAVAGLAGQHGGGAGARGLLRAARALGARTASLSRITPTGAFLELQGWLGYGWAGVLSFDRDDHWVTAVGSLGPRVVVVDCAAVIRPMVSTMTRDELIATWRAKHRNSWYAILVGV